MRMIVNRPAAVAAAFSNSCRPTFPGESSCAAMPEPSTSAARNADPRSSASALRGSAGVLIPLTPDLRSRRMAPRLLRCPLTRRVTPGGAFEEGPRHLRAPGVVVEDEKHLPQTLRSGGQQQLLGVLDRQPGAPNLCRDRAGVVVGALDRHLHLLARGMQDRASRARVTILGLAHRAAVDEQHAAEFARPRFVGMAARQYRIALGRSEPLVEARRLVHEKVL